MLPNIVLKVITQAKHEQIFNAKVVSQLFQRVEGPQAWFQMTQGTNREGFIRKLRVYHQDVILKCPGRVETYVAMQDKMLTNYGSFLQN